MKQEERTELTRKKIMKAAVNEFGTYGYEGGTIGRICKTGNINKGLIYHNFKDKDALYLACMKESCDLGPRSPWRSLHACAHALLHRASSTWKNPL